MRYYVTPRALQMFGMIKKKISLVKNGSRTTVLK